MPHVSLLLSPRCHSATSVTLLLIFNAYILQAEPDTRSWRLNVLRTMADIIWRSRRTVAPNSFEFRSSARIPVIAFTHDASGANSRLTLCCVPAYAQISSSSTRQTTH